MEIKDNLERRN